MFHILYFTYFLWFRSHLSKLILFFSYCFWTFLYFCFSLHLSLYLFIFLPYIPSSLHLVVSESYFCLYYPFTTSEHSPYFYFPFRFSFHALSFIFYLFVTSLQIYTCYFLILTFALSFNSDNRFSRAHTITSDVSSYFLLILFIYLLLFARYFHPKNATTIHFH